MVKTWCVRKVLPIKLTIKPRMETSRSLSCLTSGGSIALSTASEKMKKEMNKRKRPFTKPDEKYKIRNSQYIFINKEYLQVLLLFHNHKSNAHLPSTE